jgi:hypothetical protein
VPANASDAKVPRPTPLEWSDAQAGGNTTKVAAGELRLSGWWFDISNGVTHAHERESRSFAVVDHELADRMIARLGEA